MLERFYFNSILLFLNKSINLVISHYLEVTMFLTNLHKAVLFAMAPRLSRIPVIFGVGFLTRYDKWYESLKHEAIAYHKAQLRHLDHQFKWNEAGQELIRQREIARAQGIGPLDPKYPDIHDVIND